jgi:hypothetical protein
MALIPASIRNNNPGAMYPGRSARRFGSTSYETLRSRDGVHKIATFPTSVHGGAALFDLLASPAYTGRSIRKAIEKWCGGYYVQTYIAVLETKAGVTADTILTREMVHDAQFAIPLARAMALQEAGKAYPMTLAEWRAAHEMAFAGELAPAWTPDNDVPTRAPEDKRDDAVKTALSVGGAGATVTVANEAVKLAPPDMSSWIEWQSFAKMGAELVTWASSNVVALGLAVAAAGAVWSWRMRQ